MNVKDIISDKEVERVHGNADFGTVSKRDVISHGLLTIASDYYQGSAARRILKTHKLITSDYKLTEQGKEYLYTAFAKNH